MSVVTGDYAHTPAAEAGRRAKAARIAAWCWSRAITAADLDGMDAGQLDRVAGQTRVGYPGPGSTTWHHVKVNLERMTVWATEHPDDPRARQEYAGLRHTWVHDAPKPAPATHEGPP